MGGGAAEGLGRHQQFYQELEIRLKLREMGVIT